MSKSADAFRTISEVADWLGVQAHVLRFWESKFTQIKPVKRAGGRRYYRPADMLLLGGIQKLLHKDGLSIKDVQTILRDQGVAFVSKLSQELESDDPIAEDLVPASGAVETTTPAAAEEDTSEQLQSTEQAKPADVETVEEASEPAVVQPHPAPTEVEPNVAAEVSADAPTEAAPALEAASATPETVQETLLTAPVAETASADETEESQPTGTPETVQPTEPQASTPVAPEPTAAPPEASPIPEDASLEQPVAAVSTPEPQQMHMELDGPASPVPEAQPLVESASATAMFDPQAQPTELSETTFADTADDFPNAVVKSTEATAAATPVEETQQSLPTFDPEEAEQPPTVVADALSAEPVQEAEAVADAVDPAAAETPAEEQDSAPVSTDPATTVLSLLEHTSELPANVMVEVAQCAAELRAIQAAR